MGSCKRPFLALFCWLSLVHSTQSSHQKSDVTGHFTVKIGNEAAVDLVLIQPFLHYYGNDVVIMLTSIFYYNF